MQLPPSVPLAMALGSGMCAAVATSSPAEIGSYKRRPTLDSFRWLSIGSSRSRAVRGQSSAPPPRPPDTPSPAMERWQTARERVGSAPTRRRLRSPKSARVTSKSPLLAVLPEGTVVTAAIERAVEGFESRHTNRIVVAQEQIVQNVGDLLRRSRFESAVADVRRNRWMVPSGMTPSLPW